MSAARIGAAAASATTRPSAKIAGRGARIAPTNQREVANKNPTAIEECIPAPKRDQRLTSFSAFEKSLRDVPSDRVSRSLASSVWPRVARLLTSRKDHCLL